MTALDIVDKPPAGWFPLEVVQEANGRKGGWVALMVDANPDDLKTVPRTVQQVWLRIPGRHYDKDAAKEALKDMLATRH